MPDVFRILQAAGYRAPKIPGLVDAVLAARAGQGDLLDVGKALLDVAQPGAAAHVDSALAAVMRSADLIMSGRNDVIDGEAHEVPPWWDFATHHLPAMTWGVVVIFGSKGYGKTVLATKLAHTWHLKLPHYHVETVNFHDEDKVPWARAISMRRLVARITKVAHYIDQEDDGDAGDGIVLRPPGKKGEPPREPIQEYEIDLIRRRIVIVDEAALAFSQMAAAGQSASREAARNLNNQARHLKTLFVFICQKQSEMPTYLQDDALQFYKFASPEIVNKDRKAGQMIAIRERWIEVLAALDTVPTSRYYAGPLARIEAWSYVVAPTAGGHGYRGICPNTEAPRFLGEAA